MSSLVSRVGNNTVVCARWSSATRHRHPPSHPPYRISSSFMERQESNRNKQPTHYCSRPLHLINRRGGIGE
jgi:hypothetical protein